MTTTLNRAKAIRDHARDARRLIVQTVHVAKAGHVGGPLSAAEILSVLYFETLNIDPARPAWPDRDRFVLSKGHSALVLYSTLALRGYFPIAELRTFDQIDSRLQGHPDMTRLPGLDMSTGSLGQGLSAGVGMALGAKVKGKAFRTYVLIGDGECQEGQIWEAAQVAARYRLDNLVAILDLNRLQQFGWRSGSGVWARAHPGNMQEEGFQDAPLPDAAAKWAAFGWQVIEVNGHDVEEISRACDQAKYSEGKPVLIVAHTVKGKGVAFMENDPDWHAKVPTDEELASALDDLGGDLMLPTEDVFSPSSGGLSPPGQIPSDLPRTPGAMEPERPAIRWEPVTAGMALAQRDVFGHTLVKLAEADPDVVVLDGDLGNSTKADIFAKAFPERFLQMGIAEQNMVSVAAGLASVGLKPWISTFTAFLVKRAADQVRVAVAQTHLPVKLVGSYSGIGTNRTGKSHQSIEDLTMLRAMPGMTVIAPADGIEEAQAMAAMNALSRPAYMRINRDATRAVFDDSYRFEIGRAVILKEGTALTIISTGVQTVRALEAAVALEAAGISIYLLHVPTLKPLDALAIVTAAKATGRVLTTEENTVLGGLGGAVAEVLGERHPVPIKRLGLQDVYPESGSDEDLLEKYGLSVGRIVFAAKEWLAR